jgi:hypothetical protein
MGEHFATSDYVKHEDRDIQYSSLVVEAVLPTLRRPAPNLTQFALLHSAPSHNDHIYMQQKWSHFLIAAPVWPLVVCAESCQE